MLLNCCKMGYNDSSVGGLRMLVVDISPFTLHCIIIRKNESEDKKVVCL